MRSVLNENQKYIRAKKKVDDLKGFYSNIGAYFLVIPMLYIINKMTVPQFQWFWFPMIGWGFGIAMHALHVFGISNFLGRNWEERKIKEIIEKDENRQL